MDVRAREGVWRTSGETLAKRGGLPKAFRRVPAVWLSGLLTASSLLAGEGPATTESQFFGNAAAKRTVREIRLGEGAPSAAALSAGRERNVGLACRAPALRQDLLAQYGGSAASEAAVKRALQWIVDHQLPDGGWCFDHQSGPTVNGRARTSDHPGDRKEARNAATAMALLPLLGAGHTPKQGDYPRAVRAGLQYLVDHQQPDGGWMEPQGTMYSHGLAAIAVCEAYGMTSDPALLPKAQAAADFICKIQDPASGGWRYQRRQSGDTSVTGWQVAALKTGQMSGLKIPLEAFTGVNRFLNTVEQDGAYYGYTSPGLGPATTAIGMLCRMYLGRARDSEAAKKGLQFLRSYGPSTGAGANLYYDYYATQVLWHTGGRPWEAWNRRMRDFLVGTQATERPAEGSWFFTASPGGEAGGRLYNTSLATLILEVYYRHPPIYKELQLSGLP